MTIPNIRGKSWDEINEQLLVKCDDITEIEANGGTSLFIKKAGKRIEIENVFESEEDYIAKTNVMANIMSQKHPDAEPDKFLVEGRIKLPGNSARCHIMMPPSVFVPQVTIAKKSLSLSTLESIRDRGSFNAKMYDFMLAAVGSDLTMVISGGTGAGKTTLLEALSKKFSHTERIGVVEDSPELVLEQQNTTYYHSTPWRPGLNVNEVATLDWCVQQINRARTDKLIIGETRGGEFAGFIIGANSGMEGSLTTIHANNASMCLQKMTQFVVVGLPQPIRSANESISRTIDIIIQLGFDRHGKNRTLQIVEVSNTLGIGESAPIAVNPIFTFDRESGTWEESGRPSDGLRNKLSEAGYDPISYESKGKAVTGGIPQRATFGSTQGLGSKWRGR